MGRSLLTYGVPSLLAVMLVILLSYRMMFKPQRDVPQELWDLLKILFGFLFGAGTRTGY